MEATRENFSCAHVPCQVPLTEETGASPPLTDNIIIEINIPANTLERNGGF